MIIARRHARIYSFGAQSPVAAFALVRRCVLTSCLPAQTLYPHSDVRRDDEGPLQSSGGTGPSGPPGGCCLLVVCTASDRLCPPQALRCAEAPAKCHLHRWIGRAACPERYRIRTLLARASGCCAVIRRAAMLKARGCVLVCMRLCIRESERLGDQLARRRDAGRSCRHMLRVKVTPAGVAM